MLNTFFFGYLSLKWRRLVRTLILLFLLLIIIWIIDYELTEDDNWNSSGDYRTLVQAALGLIVLTPIVSYILKPFVVKEK
jgi:putative flippase GtrA